MLSDLSFLKFPEPSPGLWLNIVLLLVLLAATAIITALVQNYLHRRTDRHRQRGAFEQFRADLHIDDPMRDMLEQLEAAVGVKQHEAFVHDAERYEEAVALVARTADDRAFAALGRLRRALRMTVMNPDLPLLNTRQLVPDQSVRLIATVGADKLDLYCSVLQNNDHWLLIDVPYHRDVHEFLHQNPEVQLIYWREREGETVFRVQLEALEAGRLTLFRAEHGFRDEGAAKRSSPRLSVQRPLHYTFITRADLLRRRKTRKAPEDGGEPDAPKVHPKEGEGTLVDLSHGGAAFTCPHLLERHGFAQLEFEFNKKPFHLILEVLSAAPQDEGGVMVRGQFRGLSKETQTGLERTISSEQVRRLRERGVFLTRPAD